MKWLFAALGAIALWLAAIALWIGTGPIEDPTLLAAALNRGVESVKAGKPYLIDVITQPR